MTDNTQLSVDLHQLASALGVLGLRWYVIRQALPVDVAVRRDVTQFEESLAELRERVRWILVNVADAHADDAQSPFSVSSVSPVGAGHD